MVRFSTQHCCAKNRYRVTWQPNLLQQRCRNLKSVQSCATRCDNNCCIKNHLQTPCYTYRFFCATKIVVLQFPDWSPVSRLVPQFPDWFPDSPVGSPVSWFPYPPVSWLSYPPGFPVSVSRFPLQVEGRQVVKILRYFFQCYNDSCFFVFHCTNARVASIMRRCSFPQVIHILVITLTQFS